MSTSDKCNICNHPVQDNQDGLLCDKCNNWKHRTCMSMTQKMYTQIGKSNEPWYCTDCKNNTKKQQTKNYTINDVMEKLEEMDRNYHELLAKFQNQVKINENLQRELIDIKKQLNKKEQKELKNNLIIQGVPYKPDENLQDIVGKIGSRLEVTPTGKFTAYRFAKQGEKNGAIKVTFEDEDDKKQLLKSKKKLTLQCNDLGYNTNHKIYLNHDLTKTNLLLFKTAKTFKTNNGYKYLWISNGNILLRKDDKARIVQVEDMEQLQN